ncbi:MBL fold metallo-hydrolase [Amycolatopsis nigrescens]|uniref:MBL fold metallo-hydrolase n=1 Tax=Amycolatopsis nigrescens TaxID=381445 RepID=UPI00039EAFB3|nr:MBL fold metallo-hydrolase [Amycolatopsis nigrescens]
MPDANPIPDVSRAPAPIVKGEPVQVAEGVFVLADHRVPIVPNIGIVVGERAALVVDTGLGPRNGRYALEQARRLADGRPLYLTITHFHPEHGFGAQAFKGAATIIYNRAQRDELRRKGAGYLDLFTGMGPGIADELAEVELTGPDITYAGGQAEIDLGGHTVVLHEWGPAHSAADQTVLVDGRVLFTGDLAETRMFPITPYFPPHDTDVDVDRWITALDRLLAMEPTVVVPGHGEINDASLLGDVRGYLDHVRGETLRLRADGTGLDEATAVIERDARVRWPDWDNPEWIGLTVKALYATSQT